MAEPVEVVERKSPDTTSRQIIRIPVTCRGESSTSPAGVFCMIALPEEFGPPGVLPNERKAFPMTLPWFSNVQHRQLRAQRMNSDDIDDVELRTAFRGISRANAISFTDRKFWYPIRRIATTGSPLRVLDVACGNGDLTIRLARLARRTGLNVIVDGCDISPNAITFARELADDADVPSRFFHFDATSRIWPDHYDVIMTSLFLHRLKTEDAVNMLQNMSKSARKMVLVSDLVRCRTGFLLARFGVLFLTRSRMIQFDGPASVSAAFTLKEIKVMATEAGLQGATVSRIWPSRVMLEWQR